MIDKLQFSNIPINGLFLNADADFNTEDFRRYCFQNDIVGHIDQNKCNDTLHEHLFDELLHKYRFVVERTNACFDAFKAILVYFKTNATHWKVLYLLAFAIILIRKL